MSRSPFLVSSDWLRERLGDPNVSIVDGSWFLPNMERNGAEEYDRAHIPGAVFFDIDRIVDPHSDLSHALAPPDVFAREVGKLGIAHDDTIVVYDSVGLFSAPRVWWNFRIMGAAKVVILDGGLSGWINERMPIESGSAPIYPKLFVPSFDARRVVDLAEMRKLVDDGNVTIADARPAGRFDGSVPEPREGMRSGHMPGAINVPFDALQENGRLLDRDALRRVLDEAGVTDGEPVVTSCGSGVTAATISLALETIGHTDHRLYDGSWSEWGGRSDTPVETG